MVALDEPPSRERQDSGSVMVNDLEGMLLLPDGNLNEIAVCNPAMFDGHFLYRARHEANNGYGEKSLIKYQKLRPHFQLDGTSREILSPEYQWEKDGIEDPRISKNGEYYIVYTAFNEDPLEGGAKVALATTDDFRDIKKHGIIGPQVRLEEAIRLVGRDSYYGEFFKRRLNAVRGENPYANPFIMDKNATIVYSTQGNPIFLHRIAGSIQATPFNSKEELQKEEFWESHLQNIEKETILYPGKKDSDEDWASEKVGLGGTPRNIGGRMIGHVHGVEKRYGEGWTEYTYRSTFAEFDPETYRIISLLKDPLLNPHPEFTLIETNEGNVTRKFVNFATEIGEERDSIYSISGMGDLGIGYRTTDRSWLLPNLSHPHNDITNWKSCIEG